MKTQAPSTIMFDMIRSTSDPENKRLRSKHSMNLTVLAPTLLAEEYTMTIAKTPFLGSSLAILTEIGSTFWYPQKEGSPVRHIMFLNCTWKVKRIYFKLEEGHGDS